MYIYIYYVYIYMYILCIYIYIAMFLSPKAVFPDLFVLSMATSEGQVTGYCGGRWPTHLT